MRAMYHISWLSVLLIFLPSAYGNDYRLGRYYVPIYNPPSDDPSVGCYYDYKGGRFFHPVRCASAALYWWNDYQNHGHDPRPFRVFGHFVEEMRQNLEVHKGVALLLPYNFPWEFGDFQRFEAPWYSGMAQGMALSVFSRWYQTKGHQSTLAILKGLSESLLPKYPELRIVYEDGDDLWVEEYPWLEAPDGQRHPSHVLNGGLMGILGLHDYAAVANVPEAEDRFHRAAETFYRNFPRYDTGLGPAYSLLDTAPFPKYLVFDSPVPGKDKLLVREVSLQTDKGELVSHLLMNDGCKRWPYPVIQGQLLTFSLDSAGEPSDKTFIDAIDLIDGDGSVVAHIDVGVEGDTAGDSLIYAPPRWGYGWGQPQSVRGRIARAVDHSNPKNSWFRVRVPESASTRLFLRITYLGGFENPLRIRMPTLPCRYEIGTLFPNGLEEWRSIDLPLPTRDKVLGRKSKPYLGWEIRTDTPGGYVKATEMAHVEDGWNGAWIKLLPLDEKAVNDIRSADQLILSVDYKDTTARPVFLKFWNGEAHIVGRLNTQGDGTWKHEDIPIPSPLFKSNLGFKSKTDNVVHALRKIGQFRWGGKFLPWAEKWRLEAPFSVDAISFLVYPTSPRDDVVVKIRQLRLCGFAGEHSGPCPEAQEVRLAPYEPRKTVELNFKKTPWSLLNVPRFRGRKFFDKYSLDIQIERIGTYDAGSIAVAPLTIIREEPIQILELEKGQKRGKIEFRFGGSITVVDAP